MVFNPETMKTALVSAIEEAKQNGIPVKDICFSGNGEPSMSPFFTEAVNAASAIRSALAAEAKLVLITNGAALLNQDLFDFFKNAALHPVDLDIWLKLDAATESWYRFINRSSIPHDLLLSHIMSFAASGTPFTIQTMLCTLNDTPPSMEENIAWIQLVTELAELSVSRSHYMQSGPAARKSPGRIPLRKVQIYGKARPAKEDPLANAATVELLEERAMQLRQALEKAGTTVPVEVYE
jgi:histidinol dehydrogenase